jgi:hypothetical protein
MTTDQKSLDSFEELTAVQSGLRAGVRPVGAESGNIGEVLFAQLGDRGIGVARRPGVELFGALEILPHAPTPFHTSRRD